MQKQDACLGIDVFCYCCERRVALSNTVEFDGRRYCFHCDEKLRPLERIFIEEAKRKGDGI